MAEKWDIVFDASYTLDGSDAAQSEAPCGFGDGKETEFHVPWRQPFVPGSLAVQVGHEAVDPGQVTPDPATGSFLLAAPPPKGAEVSASFTDVVPEIFPGQWYIQENIPSPFAPPGWRSRSVDFAGDDRTVTVTADMLLVPWAEVWGRLGWGASGCPEGWTSGSDPDPFVPDMPTHHTRFVYRRLVRSRTLRLYLNPSSALWRLPGERIWRRSGDAVTERDLNPDTGLPRFFDWRGSLQIEAQPMPGYAWGGGLFTIDCTAQHTVHTHVYRQVWPPDIPKPPEVSVCPVWTPGQGAAGEESATNLGRKYTIVARLDGRLETRITRLWPLWRGNPQ